MVEGFSRPGVRSPITSIKYSFIARSNFFLFNEANVDSDYLFIQSTY